MTSLGAISNNIARDITTTLSNNTFMYSLPDLHEMTQISTSYVTEQSVRYGKEQFYRIMIDTGASAKSTVRYEQYLAYIHTIQEVDIQNSEASIKFGISETLAVGSMQVVCPMGTITFHIVTADIPFLLSLADLDRLKVYFNNLTNMLVTPQGEIPVVRRFGYPFLV